MTDVLFALNGELRDEEGPYLDHIRRPVENEKVMSPKFGLGESRRNLRILHYFTKELTTEVPSSSRPIPACVGIFSECPKLHLQDLTYDDIRFCSVNHFYTHHKFK